MRYSRGVHPTELFQQGSLFAFVTAFVGGFLTSLTPCVYPLIPITVSLFGARDENVSRTRAILLAAAYVGGIALTYTTLGLAFALTGRQFGTFMANPKVIVPIAILFLAMAASMFGAFDLNLPSGLQQRLSSVGGRGFFGAFAMGLVSGIIAAPCTGPVLASLLTYVATTRSILVGGSLLFTYALGMGLLFFAIAAFAVSLPKSGAWMETVKSLFGVAMVVAALYYLRNVFPALASYGRADRKFLSIQVALILAGLLLGAIHLSFHGGIRERLRKGLGVFGMVAGLFGSIGWLLAPRTEIGGPQLTWLRGEPAAMADARARHRPALLDFYADWCLPCKELELKTLDAPEVMHELERFTLGKVDNTKDDDPEVVALQKRYDASTLPTLVLMDSNGQVVERVRKVISPAELLALLRKVH
jgi:thiol:disulfide interchange protein DsbD